VKVTIVAPKTKAASGIMTISKLACFSCTDRLQQWQVPVAYMKAYTSQESWAVDLACSLHEDCAQESAPNGERQSEFVLLWYGL
jgi:hypothetical protein